ncbi:MAG: hypothetical protein FWC47_06875 [Oscillospiraceae bacterium]|nr:hypothetical protein [Oscillospiraceae bacterium]
MASKVDVIKWEHGLKLLVKMVFAKLCINIVPHLLLACYLQAGKWIDDLGNMTIGSDVMNLGSTANDQISGLLTKVKSFWAIIGLFLSVFIVVLAIKICGLVVSVMAFGRMFELYVYVVISPLPCAFLPLGNGDGTGFSHLTAKFFRGFGAVCLQGVMMLICLKIFGLLMSAAVNTAIQAGVKATEAANAPASAYTVAVGDLCFALLLACIVLVMSLVKCGGWAKSVLDVG